MAGVLEILTAKKEDYDINLDETLEKLKDTSNYDQLLKIAALVKKE